MNGRSYWLVHPRTLVALDPDPILGAVVADDHVAFDVVSEGERYAVSLFRAAAGGAWWKGQWRCKGESGHVEAQRYSAEDGGSIALIGAWHQAGVEQPWFVVLRPSPATRP